MKHKYWACGNVLHSPGKNYTAGPSCQLTHMFLDMVCMYAWSDTLSFSKRSHFLEMNTFGVCVRVCLCVFVNMNTWKREILSPL